MAKKRNDVTVKIDADVAEEAKVAASFKRMSLAEYLTETMRSIVKADIKAEYERSIGTPTPKRKER